MAPHLSIERGKAEEKEREDERTVNVAISGFYEIAMHDK